MLTLASQKNRQVATRQRKENPNGGPVHPLLADEPPARGYALYSWVVARHFYTDLGGIIWGRPIRIGAPTDSVVRLFPRWYAFRYIT